jgi:hypothetical protein
VTARAGAAPQTRSVRSADGAQKRHRRGHMEPVGTLLEVRTFCLRKSMEFGVDKDVLRLLNYGKLHQAFAPTGEASRRYRGCSCPARDQACCFQITLRERRFVPYEEADCIVHRQSHPCLYAASNCFWQSASHEINGALASRSETFVEFDAARLPHTVSGGQEHGGSLIRPALTCHRGQVPDTPANQCDPPARAWHQRFQSPQPRPCCSPFDQ